MTDNLGIYEERLDLIKRTIALEEAARVPRIYTGTAFSPRYMGMSIAEYCADPESAFQVTLQAMDRLGYIDGANQATNGRMTPRLSTLWMAKLGVPGRDLPDDALWQVLEEEVLTREDYDTILEVGWRPFLRSYLPGCSTLTS